MKTIQYDNEGLIETFKYVKNAHMDVDPGWYTLVHSLCKRIDDYLGYKSKIDPNAGYIHICQIKEKFGCLRFYYDDYSNYKDYISGMVDFAESLSYNICETCGKPGKLRKGGWLKTFCDEHADSREVCEGKI